MKSLWKLSEIGFALLFIVLYVTGSSVLDEASGALGMDMVLTLPFIILLIGVMFGFVRSNGLSEYYGLNAPKASPARMLWYLPLIPVATVNLWFGISTNKGFIDGLVYFAAMIAVGIAEELIFRGFLFRAMARRKMRAAIVLSSVFFGTGHIVNLFNGSGMALVENLCQLCYAVSVGFLLAAVLVRSGSLLPCIATHSAFNALSLFANELMHERYQIPVAVALCVLSAAAAGWYLRDPLKSGEV